MYRYYYKKTREERIKILKQTNRIDEQDEKELNENSKRLYDTANHLIENQISTYELPYGIATGFLINETEYVIPMATEEPSVIAAASFAATTIARGGGFQSNMDEKYIVGQIIFDEYSDTYIDEKKLIEIGHQSYPSILKYGGIKEIYFEEKKPYLTCYVVADTGEAMGANMINTILEGIADYIVDKYHFSKLMAILSNYGSHSLVKAKFKIDPNLLTKDGFEGKLICAKMIKANDYAKRDVYRAATHNKGIMNGISAVVLASGNDTRAIEAGVHTYANQKPLTEYYFEDGLFVGEIELPINVGSIGGSIKVHPMAKLTMRILDYPSAKQLSQMIACVGLAQNFAALRALVSSGIQKGHMKLHYKTLALSCGAMDFEIDKILSKFNQEKIKNEEVMKKVIDELRKEIENVGI